MRPLLVFRIHLEHENELHHKQERIQTHMNGICGYYVISRSVFTQYCSVSRNSIANIKIKCDLRDSI